MPIFGADPITSPVQLRALVAHPPSTKKVECMSFHPLGSARMSADPRDGVVKPTGETWSTRNLFVADGSVLPSSIGVNSQLPVMAIALRIARGLAAVAPQCVSRGPLLVAVEPVQCDLVVAVNPVGVGHSALSAASGARCAARDAG